MDLKEFVRETVLSINDALMEIEECRGGHFELASGNKAQQATGHDWGRLHFDVAVFAGDETMDTKTGDLGARIHVVSAGGAMEHSSNSVNQSTSRISFDLVMTIRGDRKKSISVEDSKKAENFKPIATAAAAP